MPKPVLTSLLAMCGLLAAVLGCSRHQFAWESPTSASSATDYCRAIVAEIEYPATCCQHALETAAIKPLTLNDLASVEYLDMTLEEILRIALSQAEVMNELGVSVLRQPTGTGTRFDPAITETDPRFGVEAALSAFDTQYTMFLNGENIDRPFLGNSITGGGNSVLDQDLFGLDAQLTKSTAYGTRFALRKEIDYDASNLLTNQFSSGWDVSLLVIARQPLLRGAGLEINRIAGPNALAGLPNGVLIARTRTDVSLADFERNVVDFVSNVENLYWDLYFAYRNLDARFEARDASLETWQRTKELLDGGHVGADQEAQARVQYFQFQQQAQDALAGRLISGTRTDNGSSGGTFNGSQGGVLTVDRRLRLLIGLPINDGTLLRPSDEPLAAEVTFDWCESSQESVQRRVELRRQRWTTKLSEMRLIAARNQTLPQLDLIGGYRLRGFGQDLAKKDNDFGTFNNAYDEFFGGDYQEWQFGVQMEVPLGFRQGHAAVRNAQLSLSRDRRILQEQERQVLHDLSNAFGELERSYQTMKTAYNLLQASDDQLESIQAAFDAQQTSLFVLLDVQRRRAEAEISYQRTRVDYALAVRNVHFEKGSLLDFNQVYLSEAPNSLLPSAQAFLSGVRQDSQRFNYGHSSSQPISRGPYVQHIEPLDRDIGSELIPLPDATDLLPIDDNS